MPVSAHHRARWPEARDQLQGLRIGRAGRRIEDIDRREHAGNEVVSSGHTMLKTSQTVGVANADAAGEWKTVENSKATCEPPASSGEHDGGGVVRRLEPGIDPALRIACFQ